MYGKIHRSNIVGFTLIELLVVVLILAILMAIALPLYLSAVRDSQLRTCQSNMQTIANAVQANYVKNKGGTYFDGTVTPGVCAAALADLQTAPVCPNGATNYEVDNTVAPFEVRCAVAASGHGAYLPGSGPVP